MQDLTSAKLIYLKGFLFLAASALACAILIIEQPAARTLFLLAIAIWSFARFYYFAFYVIERYVDSRYQFTGIWSLAGYLVRSVARSRRA